MRKHKTLVHAPVIEDYLLGQDNERIEYLELPGDPEKYSIDEDIKKGAVQFTELRGLISRRRISRVVTLTSETIEMGLIAVTYAAMEVLKRNKDLLDPEENEIYADGWNDSIRNVPIIQFSEIISHMSNDSMSYADRGFMTAQEQVGKKRVPYWERCRRNPVCIVVKPNFANPGYIDYLNMFSGNKHVYVLFVESERDKQQNEEEFFMYDGMDSQHFTALRNNFILTNTSDYADISFGESDGKEYYTSVFKENITRRGLSVEKNFSYSRVIDLATSINKDNVCMMIDKIISYSVKDIEDKTRYKLKNSDFDFADHFMRIKSPIENEGNGRELMEKNLVGIEDIKEQVYDVVNVMKYNKIRRSMNISGSNYHNVHVMLGAPGTAKTTVARYMGQMMFNEKLLQDIWGR